MPSLERSRKFLTHAFQVSWKFFTGVIVAAVAFFGNFHDFKKPDVTVEVTAVATASDEPIDIERIPELAAVREFLEIGGAIRLSAARISFQGYRAEEIDRMISIATEEARNEGRESERLAAALDALISNPKPDQETQIDELVGKIRFGLRLYSEYQSLSEANHKEDVIQKKIELARKFMKAHQTRTKERLEKSAEATAQWAIYKKETLPKKTRLIVTCAVGNRGSGATSLKPQALLRANLGDGNYLDLAMKLSGYESSSDLGVLPSQSFKILRFQSDEVQSMNLSDRRRYDTFLGNISPATIYISDVRGDTYSSNSVPFSLGIYEQKVYDSLKRFASGTHPL
jgi:hypothetical protein